MAPEEMMDEKAAGAFLGIAPATLRIWRTTKRYPLPYYKVGHFIRYRRTDLEAFIEAGRHEPQPRAACR